MIKVLSGKEVGRTETETMLWRKIPTEYFYNKRHGTW